MENSTQLLTLSGQHWLLAALHAVQATGI